MILVDANLLVYSFAQDLPQHDRAREWLDDRLNGTTRVGLPWESLLAFVRLVSNPRIFERPAPVPRAWRQVEEWLAVEQAWIPLPTPRHQDVLGGVLKEIAGRANLVPDAHLAALAIEHGLTVCSSDGDFARFSDVRWSNPLG
ncbi:MAG: type II toxin-antitoxin system VapC family toxin [Gemmatimonadales bacterium]